MKPKFFKNGKEHNLPGFSFVQEVTAEYAKLTVTFELFNPKEFDFRSDDLRAEFKGDTWKLRPISSNLIMSKVRIGFSDRITCEGILQN